MSRNFAQTLLRAYSPKNVTTSRHDTDDNAGDRVRPWPKRLSASAFVCVLAEANQLYGESVNLTSDMQDSEIIEHWSSLEDDGGPISSDIMKIFTRYRFAPHRISYGQYHRNSVCYAAGRHIELFNVLEANGFRFEEDDQSAV